MIRLNVAWVLRNARKLKFKQKLFTSFCAKSSESNKIFIQGASEATNLAKALKGQRWPGKLQNRNQILLRDD